MLTRRALSLSRVCRRAVLGLLVHGLLFRILSAAVIIVSVCDGCGLCFRLLLLALSHCTRVPRPCIVSFLSMYSRMASQTQTHRAPVHLLHKSTVNRSSETLSESAEAVAVLKAVRTSLCAREA